MINKKVIFFCRKNDFYSNLLINFLRKKLKKFKIIYSENFNDKINEKLIPNNIDFIFCFRSYFILDKKILNKAKISINFHPGPPNYRGIGCVNFALLNNEKTYGVTCHIIDEKIDNGKIIDVKRFKIQKMNLENVLKKSYEVQVKQFQEIVSLLLKKDKMIDSLLKKNKKEKWSKKITTRKDLNDLYFIKNLSKKKTLRKILRATCNDKFSPYFMIDKKKYEISEK
tara:strand:- start:586 stop:1263 length:678 start_codon:yes stop_codon:yes gene_type:complete